VQTGTPDVLFGDSKTIDLTTDNFRVLTLTRNDKQLMVELIAGDQKIKLALNNTLWPSLKSGDIIQLKETQFILL